MFGLELPIGLLVALFVVVLILANSIKILPEYERGVVFRLGASARWTTGRDCSS